jgi:hypothetical protein
MKKRFWRKNAVVPLAALLLATPAMAIEHGRPDSAHRAVGALGFDVDGAGPLPPFALCTGFVISDRAFVTAAHCITAVEAFAVSWAVTLEEGTPEDPIHPPGVLDLANFNVFDFPMLAEVGVTTKVHLHPGHDPATLANDLAVLEFPAGTFGIRPLRLPTVGRLDHLARSGARYRRPVTLSGYGADADLGDWNYALPGYRRWGFSRVASLSAERLTLTPTRVFDAQTRPGDSGGPQLIQGVAVSLTSVGDYQRLDTEEVRAFLAPFED